MKKHLFFLCINFGLFFLSNPAFSQCRSCDHFANSIKDISLDIHSEDLQENFKTWFFSDEFEKEVKEKKGAVSFVVPYEGKKITFGGSNESKNAWEMRKINKGSTKWDFSKLSHTYIYSQVASPESLAAWVQCLKVTCDTRNQLIRVDGDPVVANNEVAYKISYNGDLLSKAPVIEEFVCTGGLDCSDANTRFKGARLKKGGQTFKFNWKQGDESEGSVFVNTSAGSSNPEIVKRNIAPLTGELLFISESLGDLNKEEEIVKITSIIDTAQGRHMADIDCNKHCEACVNRKCATVVIFKRSAAPEQIFKNLDWQCLKGIHGFSCEYSNIIPIDQVRNGKEVWFKIRTWGPPSRYRVTYDIYKAKTLIKQESLPVSIVNNTLNISVPKTGMFPMIIINLKNNRIVTFRPDRELPKDIQMESSSSDEKNINYTFKIM